MTFLSRGEELREKKKGNEKRHFDGHLSVRFTLRVGWAGEYSSSEWTAPLHDSEVVRSFACRLSLALRPRWQKKRFVVLLIILVFFFPLTLLICLLSCLRKKREKENGFLCVCLCMCVCVCVCVFFKRRYRKGAVSKGERNKQTKKKNKIAVPQRKKKNLMRVRQ